MNCSYQLCKGHKRLIGVLLLLLSWSLWPNFSAQEAHLSSTGSVSLGLLSSTWTQPYISLNQLILDILTATVSVRLVGAMVHTLRLPFQGQITMHSVDWKVLQKSITIIISKSVEQCKGCVYSLSIWQTSVKLSDQMVNEHEKMWTIIWDAAFIPLHPQHLNSWF